MDVFVADANVFLRFLINDVPEQANKAAELLRRAKSKEIKVVVPQIVIFEIQFALEKFYKFPKEQIVDKIGPILSSPYIEIQDTRTFQDALVFYSNKQSFSSNKNLDFVDCFLLCSLQNKNAKLFTFDQKLRKLSEAF